MFSVASLRDENSEVGALAGTFSQAMRIKSNKA